MRLPPGQRVLSGPMPRFGLEPFLRQWPVAERFRLRIDGDVDQALELTLEEVVGPSRRELVADLHCVATWTVRDLAWGGRSFVSFGLPWGSTSKFRRDLRVS